MDELHIRWFLLRWDRHAGHTEVAVYDDQEKAFHDYLEAERSFSDLTRGADPMLEIVLIGAESLEDVRTAYPHYFEGGSREERAEGVLTAASAWFAEPGPIPVSKEFAL
jgi:hypothetical protein